MIKVQVDASKVLSRINKINQAKANAIQKGIMDAGFFVESEVKSSIAGRREEVASVDTGRFLNSIETRSNQLFEVEVYTEVEYAKYLEQGTTYIEARQHFANSAARSKDLTLKIMEEQIKKII